VGFEPTEECKPLSTLAGWCTRPNYATSPVMRSHPTQRGPGGRIHDGQKWGARRLVPRLVDRLEFILTLEFSPTRGKTDGPEPASAIQRLTHAPLRNVPLWALDNAPRDAAPWAVIRGESPVWLVPDHVGASQRPSHAADSSGRS
jgi:hypothetical protein